jgi:hypothetical protein
MEQIIRFDSLDTAKFAYPECKKNKNDAAHETEFFGTFVSSEDFKCSGKMIIKKLNSNGVYSRQILRNASFRG